MSKLNFHVESATAVPYAAIPQIALRLGIENREPAEQIQNMALNCQVQIEVTRRRYESAEQARLVELFGEPQRWSQTLRTMHWLNLSVNVPAFVGSVSVDLNVPCSFDFNVAATKYFAALDSGEIPLCLLFSGTIFYRDEEGDLQVSQIPWELETKFRLPVSIWREMMELYYPNSVWLTLSRDVFDRLNKYKMKNAMPTWEQTLERLLEEAGVEKDRPTVLWRRAAK